MNLFIIGSGFDGAHNIEGMYEHFRDYVENIQSNHYLEKTYIERCNVDYRTYEIKDAFNVMQYIISQSGDDDRWRNFEETLGKLDFEKILHCKDEKVDASYIKEENSEILRKMVDIADELKDHFKEWVKQIKIQAEKKDSFSKLISSADVFLTFNYTETLEKIYGIKENVYHIHGKAGGDIIFGHGDKNIDFSDINKRYPGTEVGLSEIKARLRKRTEDVLETKTMKKFLQYISQGNIDNVYSYGFGYGAVDLFYFKVICPKMSSATKWYFNDYANEATRKQFEKILKEKCGFKGEFSSFHID